jgi:hypothetical protein
MKRWKYSERILKLTNCLRHQINDNLLTTFFRVGLFWIATMGMKDTLFEHKEAATTCEKNMGDANEY